ncbi:protein YgfX [Candidatus Berkiella aquae]|uniref:Toxin CptA n=1 Tax=Candidatus Berkiella aquae TaxID=295108 RepID=A0AAE3L8L3_9GAMM|nr:protein YgfX [Candidatus Berkiella aquae]MCS5711075.1 hypothetical protein [Candidatus Berkiella aquae]
MNLDCKIDLGRSKQLSCWLWLLSAFACFCTLYALPWFLALIILPLIIFYSLSLLRQQGWRNSKQAIIAIQRRRHATWYLQTASLQGWLVRYQGRAFRSPWLMIVTFQKITDKRNITVVITKDAVSSQHYTDLLAWLWI